MAKAYWVVCYREIRDAGRWAAYAGLSVPAVTAAGGRILARGAAVRAYEAGQLERTVLIEFGSLEAAVAAHESAAYQAALVALGEGAVRDFRMVVGV